MVIAIIGVLSSVVFTSLSIARQRAANTAIKANLATIRPSAEIRYDDMNYSYGTAGFALGPCPTVAGTTIFGQGPILGAIASALTASGAGGTATCVSTPLSSPVITWAVSVRLNTPEINGGATSNYWCVDYLSNSKGSLSDLSGANTSCQ